MMESTLIPVMSLVCFAGLVGGVEPGFVGCFHDSPADPDFEIDATKEVDKTGGMQQGCRKACTAPGKAMYVLFAVQGEKCFCGNRFGKHGKAESCNQNQVNSIYETGVLTTKGSKTDTDFNAVYIGCHKDKSPGRAFPSDSQKDDEGMTIPMCKAHCIDKGDALFFALQDGNQCFCGNDDGDKHGISGKCVKKCAGASDVKTPLPGIFGGPSDLCGGPFANQVYRIIPKPKTQQAQGVSSSSSSSTSTTSLPVIPPNCGVPGATVVVFILIASTSVGSQGFFTSMVLTSVMPQATASVFLGSIGSEGFVLVVSAYLGHILPDSHMFSAYYTKLLSALLCVGIGMVQVNKSFDVAGKDQSDKRDEFRVTLSEVSRPAQKHDAEGDVVIDATQDGPSVVYSTFTTVVFAQWSSLTQLSIVCLATTLNVNSVLAGGFAAQFYSISLATSITPSSLILRNGSALKCHFLGGLIFFFLAMNNIFELND